MDFQVASFNLIATILLIFIHVVMYKNLRAFDTKLDYFYLALNKFYDYEKETFLKKDQFYD